MAMPTANMLAYDSHSELNSEHGSDSFDIEEDSLSVTSDESVISATQLATNIDYAVIWEILNGCQEAAFADMPSKYQHCLSIFSTRNSCIEAKRLTEKRVVDDDGYDALLEVAGATKTASEPWSLPSPTRPLSDDDALCRQNVRALEVSQVHPTAAIYLDLDHAAVDDDIDYADGTRDAGPSMTTLESFDESMSPLLHATVPRFASAVFTSASHVFPQSKAISFQSMRRYSRLATTSLLRQARALQIDTPVFGVLLRNNLAAIHVDWYEEQNGVMEVLSAFYPLDDEESDIKTWDLNHSPEEHEFLLILSNLRKYTYGRLASQVRREVKSVSKPIQAWKRNASCLSRTLSPTQLRQHSEEPPEHKINRWQESLEISVDKVASKAWKRAGAQLIGQGKEFLSPPSTPGDV